MEPSGNLTAALLAAYSEENLNKITRNLIRLYKDREFEKLMVIAGMISDWVEIDLDERGKGFSKIISLYHPDRGEFYRKRIAELTASNDLATLEKFRHIFVIGNIEEIAAAIEIAEDIDYSPEYAWDVSSSSFRFFDEVPRKKRVSKPPKRFAGYSFYEAIQIRQYGDTSRNFPTYYLEDMDEIELSESEISDLEGAEYCIHTVSMDLSGNRITDLEPLAGLRNLQELNLSGNRLSYIDALSNLEQLKSVDLSNNALDDISPLFELGNLEYADLSGNRISASQIHALRELGVTVDY